MVYGRGNKGWETGPARDVLFPPHHHVSVLHLTGHIGILGLRFVAVFIKNPLILSFRFNFRIFLWSFPRR